jgi:hypothetical protein
MLGRKKRGRESAAPENGDSPRERYEEFARENGEWHRKVEESLTELRKLAGEESDEPRKDATRGAEPAAS